MDKLKSIPRYLLLAAGLAAVLSLAVAAPVEAGLGLPPAGGGILFQATPEPPEVDPGFEEDPGVVPEQGDPEVIPETGDDVVIVDGDSIWLIWVILGVLIVALLIALVARGGGHTHIRED